MSMFCYQCQETAKNYGCTEKGVCGKPGSTANLQDLLIYNLKGISEIIQKLKKNNGGIDEKAGLFIVESLFTTITNANFDENHFIERIKEALKIKNDLKSRLGDDEKKSLSDAALWESTDTAKFHLKAFDARILKTENEDVRSLRELLIYGVKGMAAYFHHALVLGYGDNEIYDFISTALAAALNDDLGADDLVGLVMKCGEFGVKTMALLDRANTSSYGNPEPTSVSTGVGTNPGILVSGHDLKDIEELLMQSEGKGVDIYTHGEMLPAHYYPALKKYKHLAGNYGGSWWKQAEEFEKFNGPILMTTNCLVPPKDAYRERLYTTGAAGFAGIQHIGDRAGDRPKDFSKIIEQAKKCKPPVELEKGSITGGFAHNTVLNAADKVIELINRGKIKKFVVMAGCDGRHKSREYYTEFANALPDDTVILTAGCAKYRYNKLGLGDIEGIPRVLDADQCNDSYSLAVIALKLSEVLKININDLPIEYNIAWYEQKAVIVLLALLSLGVKNIKLGPTLPAFLSPNVAKILIDTFGINGISTVENDMKQMIKS